MSSWNVEENIVNCTGCGYRIWKPSFPAGFCAMCTNAEFKEIVKGLANGQPNAAA